MEMSPEKMIAIGCLSTVLSGWLNFQLFTSSSRNLTSQDLNFFSANLIRSEEVRTGRRSYSLQLWLEGQPLPFSGSSVQYPGAYDRSVLSELMPGAKVRVGCSFQALKEPLFNSLTNQKSYEIETLDINDRPALTLEESNIARARNTKTGKIFMPIFFVLSLYLVAGGFAQKRKQIR
jgi:hypothetical protein